MNNKTAKKLRSLAKTITGVETSYFNKTTQKSYVDFNGNKLPYTTSQVALNPKCAKSVYKHLKTLAGSLSLTELDGVLLKELVDTHTSAKVQELVADGYKVVA